MIEIGAGGGSIARRDSLGLLKVGPESAGANPGPACYGGGGSEATVTDACLALGYYDPDFFLGGTMTLDAAAAGRALDELGASLDLDAVATAWGVFTVVCESMARAARVHIIEKDRDPRDFPLMAFGGAGPAHAARVARILGARTVIVPPLSGVASALGFLVAPASHEVVRSYPGTFDTLDWSAIDGLLEGMRLEAVEVLRTSGVAEADVRIERSVEARLLGQFHDIDVMLPEGALAEGGGMSLMGRFEAAYAERYHTVLDGYRPMAVTWKLRGLGSEPNITIAAARGADGTAKPKGLRRAYFPEAGGFTDVKVFDRAALPVGTTLAGPAIVEEKESTTVITPGDVLRVDEAGNLVISVAAEQAAGHVLEAHA
jgi:5-oxoprolinase (ATP-hydrolysing)/N-methylhydantoinase A